MATIELQQVEKKFGELHAVKPMDLTIQDGEFVVLLGPSGCGKTTTLRMISGLETVTSGTILLGGRNVTWLHPSERDVAFVFQFYALYPHISARDNISFPLRAQRESKEVIDQRVKEVAALLRIEHLLNQRPGNLSGGDQQRVALARSLVRRPEAFLMDEPLGALDADFRESMRAEIKQLHIDQHATTVYVTHDQIEAMTMADKIVVMRDGYVEQTGAPLELYDFPVNTFVAGFIGSPAMNLIEGTFRSANGAAEVVTEDGTVLPLPEGLVLEVGGIALLPDGRPLVCTRRGEVWIVDGITTEEPEFRLFAEGLHEPLGLLVLDGWIYVTQRGELSRMRAAVVNEASLADAAARAHLGEGLRLGRGEDRTGGRSRR